ncbi:MAG: biopolymer transporter ExbD [Terrimicrobiaceae bacterium]|jgi:biopolymer transport protein ExbD|nr:biopolymer transporter ExbD [Terrimicrobiaceae bacterium]
MQIRTDQDAPIEVDMAPLIDCVFLLLIFFLVASSLKKVDLQAELPQSGTAGLAANLQGAPAVVEMSADGRFRWKGKKYKSTRAESLLKGTALIAKAVSKGQMEIRAHPDTPSGLVLRLVDSLRLAGVKTVDIRLHSDVR